jgi:hypothetical protein
MRSFQARIPPCFFSTAITAALMLLPCVVAAQEGYVQYTDPDRRFIFDYPATMKLETVNKDEIRLTHQQASLRISVFIEDRRAKTAPDAEALIGAFKKKLADEVKDAVIIDEGKAPTLSGKQAYVICAFTNPKGAKLVQLVQYFVAPDRTLQMIISDKPTGFKNLEKVIRHIHQSLRIVNPQLK